MPPKISTFRESSQRGVTEGAELVRDESPGCWGPGVVGKVRRETGERQNSQQKEKVQSDL